MKFQVLAVRHRERPNTLFDLNHRIYSIDVDVRNDIEVRFDGSKFNENSFKIVFGD